jgi:hypothetical protein
VRLVYKSAVRTMRKNRDKEQHQQALHNSTVHEDARKKRNNQTTNAIMFNTYI